MLNEQLYIAMLAVIQCWTSDFLLAV